VNKVLSGRADGLGGPRAADRYHVWRTVKLGHRAPDQARRAGGSGVPTASGRSERKQVSASGADRRVWPLVAGLVRVNRVCFSPAGLLVAAWLVLDGLWLLWTGEGGDTRLLVAALGWLFAAVAFRPRLFLRADVTTWNRRSQPGTAFSASAGLAIPSAARDTGISPFSGSTRSSTLSRCPLPVDGAAHDWPAWGSRCASRRPRVAEWG
jgi:hypothetical protein